MLLSIEEGEEEGLACQEYPVRHVNRKDVVFAAVELPLGVTTIVNKPYGLKSRPEPGICDSRMLQREMILARL
ncbi:UNVERIFIED_CONTAM: hypothetical protein K2H54_054685 [Gekko kuhli]